MKDILYLECSSGISGDMFVGAMLDLGVEKETVKKALLSLPVEGFSIEISRVKKSGLDACDFNVILDAAHENHDHDMEYLHGHFHEHSREHSHEHLHGHEDAQGEKMIQEEHHHRHEQRGLQEILSILEQAELSERAREIAVRIFTILAEGEARAHGVPVDKVHFHEVGAVDSIADIVAAAVCVDALDPAEIIVPFVCEGSGMVRCQHGLLPIPVPAVANILSKSGIKVKMTGIEGELVTPTGAAIVAAVRTGETLPEEFRIRRIGLGAGKRNYDCAGVLRAMLLA